MCEWILIYQSLGTADHITTSKNTVYSSGLKQNVVLDYLDGEGTYSDKATTILDFEV